MNTWTKADDRRLKSQGALNWEIGDEVVAQYSLNNSFRVGDRAIVTKVDRGSKNGRSVSSSGCLLTLHFYTSDRKRHAIQADSYWFDRIPAVKQKPVKPADLVLKEQLKEAFLKGVSDAGELLGAQREKIIKQAAKVAKLRAEVRDLNRRLKKATLQLEGSADLCSQCSDTIVSLCDNGKHN